MTDFLSFNSDQFPIFMGIAMQGFLVFFSFGISIFLTILTESLFVSFNFDTPGLEAFGISLLVNLFSIIIGFIFGISFIGPIYLPILCMFLYIAWWFWQRNSIPIGISILIFFTILSTFLSLLISAKIIPEINTYFLNPYFGPAFLFGFGLSIFIHGISLKRLLKRQDIWKTAVIVNLIIYVIIFSLMGIFISQRLGARRPAYQSRAKGTLRSIASSEKAFKETNRQHVYGSFQELSDNMFIADGYRPGNMIDNYSMTWQVNNISTVQSNEYPEGIMSTFTVIAFPRNNRRHSLNTFAITEDGIVREYNPKSKKGNDYDSVKSWDPIL